MTEVVLLGIAGAAFHYLAYRATITRFLWSRYPRPLDAVLGCVACSSFWVGGALGWLWLARGGAPLGLGDWTAIPVCALVAMIAAPPVSLLHTWSLTSLSPGDPDGAEEIRD